MSTHATQIRPSKPTKSGRRLIRATSFPSTIWPCSITRLASLIKHWLVPAKPFISIPKIRSQNQNLAGAYMALNRYDEAKAVITQSQKQSLSFTGARDLYAIAFMQRDQNAMQRSLDLLKGKGIREVLLLLFKAEGEYSQGKIQAARQTFAENVNLLKSLGANEFAAGLLVSQQQLETELGYST